MIRSVVLVVDRDQEARAFLKRTLAKIGIDVLTAATEPSVLSREPDLILLALESGDAGPLQRIDRIRRCSEAPIVVLTTAQSEHLRFKALESGADDYLSKSCTSAELARRVRVALWDARCSRARRRTFHEVGELRIDLVARSVHVRDRPVMLTPREFRVLAYLAELAGHVVPQRRLLREVWGPRSMEDTASLRVIVAGLRRKIEANPDRPRWLMTERGVGYRLACA